ncbi:hypothetical protein WMF11_27455 [Sorangium sp. So ce295]|uniref:hypothetical protein n=1 Tax=Sorangium sp. So ce295 TaxID=3133295 RepID=UPI003F637EE3
MPAVRIDGLKFDFPSSSADVQQALRRLLKPVGAQPFVAETSRMGSLGWKVT